MENFNRNAQTNPQNNPLLRDFDNVSPALTLGFPSETVFDQDGIGWDLWTDFSVGDLVFYQNWVYRIVGFTLEDHIFIKPHGLHPAGSPLLIQLSKEGAFHLTFAR